MDYIKGIPHRLKALKMFFEKHPEWIEKVVLIQVAGNTSTVSCNVTQM